MKDILEFRLTRQIIAEAGFMRIAEIFGNAALSDIGVEQHYFYFRYGEHQCEVDRDGGFSLFGESRGA